MQWETLSATEFARAVKTSDGVCVVALGVLEKHGEHLPLGTDLFIGQHVALEATNRENVLLFPPYYFGQIHEAKHQPGTIALKGDVYWSLLENVCEEISRNGLKKIILFSAHGGNRFFLPYFCQQALEKKRDYCLYYDHADADVDPKLKAEIERVSKDPYDGHAGESETSRVMAIHPDLVKISRDIASQGVPKKRVDHLAGIFSGIQWYGMAPHHYMGKGALGTPEKGKLYLKKQIDNLCRVIRLVKADKTAPKLMSEFYERAEDPLA